MTGRVVTKEDIEHVQAVIKEEMLSRWIDEEHDGQFMGIVLFGAFSGQRPYSTIAQFRGLNYSGKHGSLKSQLYMLNQPKTK